MFSPVLSVIATYTFGVPSPTSTSHSPLSFVSVKTWPQNVGVPSPPSAQFEVCALAEAAVIASIAAANVPAPITWRAARIVKLYRSIEEIS